MLIRSHGTLKRLILLKAALSKTHTHTHHLLIKMHTSQIHLTNATCRHCLITKSMQLLEVFLGLAFFFQTFGPFQSSLPNLHFFSAKDTGKHKKEKRSGTERQKRKAVVEGAAWKDSTCLGQKLLQTAHVFSETPNGSTETDSNMTTSIH